MLLATIFVTQAIQAQDNAPKKKEKVKMIMIKKTIDEDGNETVEKIVKEGDEAKNFVWVEEGEDGKKDVRVIVKDGDIDIDEEIEITEGDDEEVEIKIEKEVEKHVIVKTRKKGSKKKVNIGIEEENGERTVEVKNEEDGEVEVQVITLDEGEELPEDVRKKLEEHGIDLDELMKHVEGKEKSKKKSKKKVKIIKKEKKAYK